MVKGFKGWWHNSHVLDWLLPFLFWGLGLALLHLVDAKVRPYVLPTFDFEDVTSTSTNTPAIATGWTDNKFNQLREGETLPFWGVVAGSLAIPILVAAAATVRFQDWHEFHHACLGAFQAVTVGYLFCLPVQIATGIWRPDFADRIRSQDDDVIEEGRYSFPSPHTAVAFAGMIFVACYLSGKLRTFTVHGGEFWKVAVGIVIPVGIAATVAVTRINDFKNHPVDIVAGAVLGTVPAVVVYSLLFHVLSDQQAGVAKNRKMEKEEHKRLTEEGKFFAQEERRNWNQQRYGYGNNGDWSGFPVDDFATYNDNASRRSFALYPSSDYSQPAPKAYAHYQPQPSPPPASWLSSPVLGQGYNHGYSTEFVHGGYNHYGYFP